MTRPRILAADDDALVRRLYARVLRSRFHVMVVSDGAEALALIRSGEQFAAVILDLDMPVMNGREAYDQITTLRPAMANRVLIVSGGGPTRDLAEWLARFEPSRRLMKPVTTSALVTALEAVLDEP